MCPINGVTTVDICRNEESITLIGAENICLMSRSVCSEERISVDVVGIRSVSARMICWKSKTLKVLNSGHNGEEVIVGLVAWESGFDELASDTDRMIGY